MSTFRGFPEDPSAPMKSRNVKRRLTYDVKDPSSYQQHSLSFFRDGKRSGPSASQIVKANIVRTDYWFRGVKDFDNNGYYWLGKSSSTVAGWSDMPCFFYAPFHVLQQNDNVSPVAPKPLRRLLMNPTTGQMAIGGINGEAADSTTSPDLNHVQVGGPRAPTYGAMGSVGMLDWTSLKLNLWGATDKLTRVHVELVSTEDQGLHPFNYAYSVPGATPTVVSQYFNETFFEKFRPHWTNPIASAISMSFAPTPLKTIRKYSFEFDPTTTTEKDTDPHCRTVNLFHRWNRKIHYDWDGDSAHTLLDYTDPSYNTVEDNITGVSNTRPQFAKDFFYIIYATMYSPNGTANSNATTPSFDLSFRSSFKKLDNNPIDLVA